MYAISQGEEKRGNFYLDLGREKERKDQLPKLIKIDSSPNHLQMS